MALAYDNSTAQYNGTASTSHTFAFTTSGSKRIVVASTRSYDADAITGVTYGGVSMTQVGTTTTLGSDGVKRWILVNPASGSNNFVLSLSSSRRVEIMAVSLTGAKSTSQPDANAKTTGTGTGATGSVTTVADFSWSVAFTHSNGASGTVSSGTDATLGAYIADRCGCGYGGPKTPAGSFSQTLTWSGSGGWSLEQVSVAYDPNVEATHTLLTMDSTVFDSNLNVGTTASHTLLTMTSDVFDSSMEVDQWSGESKSSSTWTNQNKS